MDTILIKTIKVSLGVALTALISSQASSQSGSLRSEFPDLANLYNSFDVSQAEVYDAIAEISADPASHGGRMELKMHLDMMAEWWHVHGYGWLLWNTGN